MKLRFDVDHKSHADPFVLQDGETYYMYTSNTYGDDGVPVYTTNDPFGEWHYATRAAKFEGAAQY